MATSTKTKSKKKAAKVPVKKAVAKKTTIKKKAVKKSIPVRKKAVAKKKAVSSKKQPIVVKKTTPKKASVSAKKTEQSNISKVPVDRQKSNNLIVEEQNAPVNSVTVNSTPGINQKDLQRAAARNYDNHHIHLSNRKGGIKPSGKKPLW